MKMEVHLRLTFYSFVTLCILAIQVFSVVGFLEVRLSLNTTVNEGRVELKNLTEDSKQWHTICDDGSFGNEAAGLVCRHLGYGFGRSTPKIFKAKDAYSTYDVSVTCTSRDTSLPECRFTDTTCPYNTGYYAGVCCSNNENFGSFVNGLFVSDCKETWLNAHAHCTELGSFLSTIDVTKNYIYSRKEASKSNFPFRRWIGKYYSPWIWSNGCVKFKARPTPLQEVNLDDRSPAVCSQYCGTTPGIIFTLAGNKCRCLARADLVEFVPDVTSCNVFCDGQTNQLCGSESGKYWSLYSIGDSDEFEKLTQPYKEERQCAQFVQYNDVRKLRGEDCDTLHDYICRWVNTSTDIIQKTKTLVAAKNSCYMKNMVLVGQAILDKDTPSNTFFNGAWVNIERVITSVYQYKSFTRMIQPEWCLFTEIFGGRYSQNITNCATERHSYTCTKDKTANIKPSWTTFKTEEPFNFTTGRPTNRTNAPHQGSDDQANLILEIAMIGVGAAIVIVIIVIIAILCWRRYSKVKEKKKYRQEITPRFQKHPNAYTAIPRAEKEPDPNGEPVYFEIIDDNANPTSENDTEVDVNSQLLPENQETTETSTDNSQSVKEPVTMKVSYVIPHDSVKQKDGERDENATKVNEEETYFTKLDTGYMFPYDTLRNVDKNEESSSQKEPDNS